MFYWRITKYNPKNRDTRVAYLINEWTAYSDINKIFDGKSLNYSEYLAVENAYINAINLFMVCNSLTELPVDYLEKKRKLYQDPNLSPMMIKMFSQIKSGISFNKNEIEIIARLVLREQLWCKLGTENTMFVHFGYDYYMYIGSAKKCVKTIQQIQQSGLFVEEFISPYLEEFTIDD
jgi:hypothetical protein